MCDKCENNLCTWEEDCMCNAKFQVMLVINCENRIAKKIVIDGVRLCKHHHTTVPVDEILDIVKPQNISILYPDNTPVYINPDPNDPDMPLRKPIIEFKVEFARIYGRG